MTETEREIPLAWGRLGSGGCGMWVRRTGAGRPDGCRGGGGGGGQGGPAEGEAGPRTPGRPRAAAGGFGWEWGIWWPMRGQGGPARARGSR